MLAGPGWVDGLAGIDRRPRIACSGVDRSTCVERWCRVEVGWRTCDTPRSHRRSATREPHDRWAEGSSRRRVRSGMYLCVYVHWTWHERRLRKAHVRWMHGSRRHTWRSGSSRRPTASSAVEAGTAPHRACVPWTVAAVCRPAETTTWDFGSCGRSHDHAAATQASISPARTLEPTHPDNASKVLPARIPSSKAPRPSTPKRRSACHARCRPRAGTRDGTHRPCLSGRGPRLRAEARPD